MVCCFYVYIFINLFFGVVLGFYLYLYICFLILFYGCQVCGDGVEYIGKVGVFGFCCCVIDSVFQLVQLVFQYCVFGLCIDEFDSQFMECFVIVFCVLQ